MPMLGCIGSKIAEQRLRQGGRNRLLAAALGCRRGGLLGRRLAPLEQRVLLDFGVDEIGQFEVR